MNALDALTFLLALAGLVVGIRAYITSDAQAAKMYAEAAKAVQEDNENLRKTVKILQDRVKILESREATCMTMLKEWANGIIILTAQLVGREITPRWIPDVRPDEFLKGWPPQSEKTIDGDNNNG